MRLTNWLKKWLPKPNRAARRAQKKATVEKSRKTGLALEALEAREVLTTTVYLDFGLGLPAAGLSTTVDGLVYMDETVNATPLKINKGLSTDYFYSDIRLSL